MLLNRFNVKKYCFANIDIPFTEICFFPETEESQNVIEFSFPSIAILQVYRFLLLKNYFYVVRFYIFSHVFDGTI
jgi:hypothetical protein